MKSFVVVGLGYGDEGKGATVDFLCHRFKVDCVVKYSGGHQAGHRVVVGDKEHVFSQYGSGALAGVPTYLDRDFIIEPMAMAAERAALRSLGANTQVHAHRCCPITTRYHRAINRLLSPSRSTCGVGVGATRLTDNLGIGLRVGHLSERNGLDVIYRLRSYLLAMAKRKDPKCYLDNEFMTQMSVTPAAVWEEIQQGSIGNLWEADEVDASSIVVFEGSQGVLLDETYGDEWATYSTVTPRNALEFPGYYPEQSMIIGVMRTYLTRHGRCNGEINWEEHDREDANNKWSRWQGPMRQTAWGKQLSRAKNIAKPDVLALNHLDERPDPLTFASPVLIEGRGPDRADRRLIDALLPEWVAEK